MCCAVPEGQNIVRMQQQASERATHLNINDSELAAVSSDDATRATARVPGSVRTGVPAHTAKPCVCVCVFVCACACSSTQIYSSIPIRRKGNMLSETVQRGQV